MNRSCQEPAAEDRCSPPLLGATEPTSDHFTVKQENPDDESFLDSIKVEELNLEGISAVQSKMLEQWKTEELDVKREDPSTGVSGARLARGEKQHGESFKQLHVAFRSWSLFHNNDLRQ